MCVPRGTSKPRIPARRPSNGIQTKILSAFMVIGLTERRYPTRVSNSPIIAVDQRNTTAVISVPHAVITADQAKQLRDGFRRAVAALPASTTTVHLDVAQVLGMSSGGFEALLVLRRTCESRNLNLTVSQLQPTFHRLLERMGFLRLLGISD